MYTVVSKGVSPDGKKVLEKHLQISSQLEDFWFYGDRIIGAIFDYRRKVRLTKQQDKNDAFRKIVKVLRKMGKYENLRSSLEAVLFEEVPDFSYLTKSFKVEGNDTDIFLTFVYFRRYAWKLVNEDRKSLEFQIVSDGEQVAEEDLAFFLCYFLRLSEFLSTVDDIMKQTNYYYACKQDISRSFKSVNDVTSFLMGILQLKLQNDV